MTQSNHPGLQWIDEVHEEHARFGLRGRVLFDQQSPFQRVTIVQTEAMGRGLLLDGLWMCTEADEVCYHEMLVHPAMTCAPKIGHVVIIGGGDGGTAREVLRYPQVERVTMIEIDALVTQACQEHIPEMGAWQDPRLTLHHIDGVEWIESAEPGSVDVLLVDGVDPVGPGEVLYSEAFYRACARALGPKGVFVAQSESPRVQQQTHLNVVRRLEQVFAHVHPYYRFVPVYPGAAWSWTFASAEVSPSQVDPQRLAHVEPQLEIYNEAIHAGAFALPNYIKRALGR